MENTNKPEQSDQPAKRRWLIPLVLAVAAALAYLLLKPARSPKEASIVTSGTKANSGHSVTVPIIIDTAGKTINASQIFLKFDKNQVQVKSLDKSGTFFTVWAKDQPAFSNTTGDISFAGGIFNPGFKGQGKVGSVTLTAKKALRTKLTFAPNTQVLLNDGLGTAIPLQLTPIEVNIP